MITSVRATPIRIEVCEAEEEEWENVVYAVTILQVRQGLVYPSDPTLDPDIEAEFELRSPGTAIGGSTGNDQEEASRQECLALTFILAQMGTPILADEAA